ncbi:MAG: oligoribonuclease [Deltaproteobacteria bacterium]|jgi:oligoribonuclease|nr:oligoribonuclease [Deltaproteobacteria bacterium]
MGTNLTWVDLEMTGLNPDTMVILEIATVVTDANLNVIAEGPHLAINYPEEVLDRMEQWSRTHHQESGLLDRVRASKCNCAQAEQATLKFVASHFKKGESPLCGNSVWQDRRFLARHMPLLEDYLHYRIIDVSSIKELAKRWYPGFPPYQKKKEHLALNDIRESIEELKYFRKNIFIQS